MNPRAKMIFYDNLNNFYNSSTSDIHVTMEEQEYNATAACCIERQKVQRV